MKVDWVRVPRSLGWPRWAMGLTGVWLFMVGLAVGLSVHFDFTIDLCWFKRVSGIPCPSCGLGRGMLALLKGQVITGWLYNPLFFSFLAVGLLVLLLRVGFKRSVKVHVCCSERILIWDSAGVLLAANWIYVVCLVG